jgi:hypothetical protein
MANGPQWELLCEVALETAPPQAIGENPHGNRLIVPITGGSFAGPHLKGTVLAGGDRILERPDGVRELNVRATWQTEDGALLYVTYRGYRAKMSEVLPRWMTGEQIPPEAYDHMVTLNFETSAAQYAWLQRVVVIGQGRLIQGGVSYRIFAVW